MGIKKHHHHHIKESPCLHCSKSKKWQARLPLQCAATQPPTAAARRPVAPWPTSAVPARLAATRPAAVPRGHVRPAPVVVETRHAVKGLVDEQSAKHDKTQQSSKDLCMCRLYISNLHLRFVHFMRKQNLKNTNSTGLKKKKKKKKKNPPGKKKKKKKKKK